MENKSQAPLIILASSSPRRRYLLKQAGLDFQVVPSTIDEASVRLAAPEIYVKILAEAKAEEIAARFPDAWVIGADTIVLKDGEILGKPRSQAEARSMLTHLSGQRHQVLTGYAICCRTKQRKFSEIVTTEVEFKRLTDQEIAWYVSTQEPFDKAGAYAIQGLGTFLVKRINGSYTNVVGLPVCEVVEFLIKEGVLGLKPPSPGSG